MNKRVLATFEKKKVKQSACLQWGLTIRSTGPTAAGRHLGYKSLAQMPSRRNGPVSSNVRPHRTSMSALAVFKSVVVAIKSIRAPDQSLKCRVSYPLSQQQASGTMLLGPL